MPLSDYDNLFQSAGKAWNVDPMLLKALTQQESGGKSGAVSSKGAYGMTQIMPQTAQNLGMTNRADPAQQIYGAAKYLNEALTAERTPEEALNYYHGGPDWRAQFGPESAGYAPAITSHYLALQAAQQAAAKAASPKPAAGNDDDDPFSQAIAAAKTQAAATPSADDPFGQAVATAKVQSAPALTDTHTDPFSQAIAVAKASLPPPEETPMAGMGGAPGTPGTPAEMPGASSQDMTQTAGHVAQGVTDIAKAAGHGISEGFGSGPLGLSPESEQALVNSGVYNAPGEYNPLKALNRAIINPLAAGADLAVRGGSALMRGGQAAVAETGAQLGAPQLGRDIAAIPEAFAGMSPEGLTARPLEAPVAGLAAPVERFPMTPGGVMAAGSGDAATLRSAVNDSAANLLARTPEAQVAANAMRSAPANDAAAVAPSGKAAANDAVNPLSSKAPAARVPSPFDEPGDFPAAAPAATPALTPFNGLPKPGPSMAPHEAAKAATASAVDTAAANATTPADRAAQVARTGAEQSRIQAPAVLGGDATEYVPGVKLTQADITGSAHDATTQKVLSQTPEGNDQFQRLQDQNTKVRSELFDKLAGESPETDALKVARSNQAEDDLTAAFGSKQPTNPAPVADTIKSILTDPRDSENTAVQQYIKPFLNRLTDADGNFKTDPEQLYGIREDISRMQSKAARQETPTLDHVTGQLQKVKESLDSVIEQGAPGYQKYLQNFSDASKPIDQQELLQSYRGKLTNGAERNFSFKKFDNMMKSIGNQRAAKGVNQAKSISPEAMDQLLALHADLRREAHTSALGNVKGGGSNTNQLGEYTKKVVGTAVEAGLAAKTGGMSIPLVGAGKSLLSGRRVRKQIQAHLNPDVAKLTKGRNPLASPQGDNPLSTGG